MRKYSGMVEDCCCDYETVDRLNEAVLHPSLQELVKTPFFRYFKVCSFYTSLFNFYANMCRHVKLDFSLPFCWNETVCSRFTK